MMKRSGRLAFLALIVTASAALAAGAAAPVHASGPGCGNGSTECGKSETCGYEGMFGVSSPIEKCTTLYTYYPVKTPASQPMDHDYQ